MEILPYLAVTGAELRENPTFPYPIAWLSCQFSARHQGLSNLPTALPRNSMVIISDQIPFQGHDIALMYQQVMQLISFESPSKILLDFQREHTEGLEELVDAFLQLPCPVAVSEAYSHNRDCPVFLSCPPLHIPLTDYLQPWKHREIWLEIAPAGALYRITESGCTVTPCPIKTEDSFPHRNSSPPLRYGLSETEDAVIFHLQRGKEEIDSMLKQAERCGIHTAVGLYQELHKL